jgi:hypothetical protein
VVVESPLAHKRVIILTFLKKCMIGVDKL